MATKPIYLKARQRFFLQPLDPNADLTFANARATEMLHAKHQMPNSHDEAPEEHVSQHSEQGERTTSPAKDERGYYEITNLDPYLLGTIYKTQQWNRIPIKLLNCIGKGKIREYQPYKGIRGLPSQIKKANTDRQKRIAIDKLLKQGIIKTAA